MSRDGMADNIARVRALTYAGTAEYTLGTATFWDDDQIEQVLDRHRVDVVREELTGPADYIGGGSVQYVRLHSAHRYIEGASSGSAIFRIEDGTGTDRGTATYTADYLTGTFDFSSDVGGTVLYMTGRAYDVHGAAAELLESWASREAREFDFTADGQSFHRSQKVKSLQEQAGVMRRRAWIKVKGLRTGA